MAQKLRSAERFIDAARAYAEAARLLPSSNAGLFAAYCLRDGGETEAAITAMKAYTELNPKDPDGWTSLGTYLKRLQRYGEAIVPLQTALQLLDRPAVRNSLVSSLWREGRLEEARAAGLRNLNLKEKQAFRTFHSSPYGDYRLKPGGRGFDPERRARNVIAFSLWGDRPEYISGAIVNAQIAQHIYVRWTARFYCDTSVPADARDALKAYGAEVILMERPEQARIRPMWRFLASDDPGVNVFLCRDADSRLNAKELLAVTDWLQSGKRFHVMRDHIYHHELILAGMWGGMAGVLPNLEEWLASASQYFDNKFADQAFLADMVWPLIREEARIHDTHYRFPKARPFPPGYELPGLIHVGGASKTMPHWSRLVHLGAGRTPKP